MPSSGDAQSLTQSHDPQQQEIETNNDNTASPRAQVALITGARVVSSIIGIAVPIIVVRVLEPAVFGYYKAVFLVAGTVLPLATLGVPASLYYLAPRHRGSDQRLFVQSAAILTVAGLAAGLLILAITGILQRTLHVPFGSYATGLAIFTGLSVPAGLLPVAPMVDRRATLTAVLLTGSDLLRSVLIVVTALLARTLSGIITAASVAIAVQVVLAFGYIAWRGTRHSTTAPAGLLREQLNYALPFTGSSVLGLTRDKLHAYFIAAAFTPVQFAVYAVAILDVPLIGQLTQTVSEVVIMQTASSFADGNLDEARRVWHTATRSLALLLVPVFVCAEVFAGELIVVLFGARYASAAPIFRVYAITIAISILLAPAMFRAMNDLGTMILADLCSLLVSIAVLVIFGRGIGPVAGALSLVAGVATFAAIGSWRLARALHIGVTTFIAWRHVSAMVLLSLATAVFGWWAAMTMTTQPIVRLFAGGALSVFLYAALIWRAGLVASTEQQIVQRWLGRLGLARIATVWPAGAEWSR